MPPPDSPWNRDKPSPEERDRILPADEPAARAVTTELERITRRILAGVPEDVRNEYEERSGKKFGDLEFTFHLSDSPEIDAYIYADRHPAPITISKGLWDDAKSEDEIAGIISHEINHKLLGRSGNKWRDEAACDLNTVRTLRNADYQEDGLQQIFKRWADKEVVDPDTHFQRDFMATVDDPHPKMRNRELALGAISAIDHNQASKETGQARKDTRSITGNTPVTKKNPAVAKLFPAARYRNILQKSLDSQGYEQKSLTEKLEMLSREADIIARELPGKGAEAMRTWAADCMADEITALAKQKGGRLNPKDMHQQEVFTRLVDQVITMDPSGGSSAGSTPATSRAYASLGVLSGRIVPKKDEDFTGKPLEKIGLLGNLEKLAVAQQRFVAAQTQDEAIAAAKEVVALQKPYLQGNLPPKVKILLRSLAPNFARPTEEVMKVQNEAAYKFMRENYTRPQFEEALLATPGLKPSYHQHMQWAEASPEVALALWSMEVVNPENRKIPRHDPVAMAAFLAQEGISSLEGSIPSTNRLPTDRNHRYNTKGEIVLSDPPTSESNFLSEAMAVSHHHFSAWIAAVTNRAPRLARREQAEMAVLAQNQWKTDFDAIAHAAYPTAAFSEFLAKYKEELTPELRAIARNKADVSSFAHGDGVDAGPQKGRAFIEAFLAHARTRMQEEPGVYVPLMQNFFEAKKTKFDGRLQDLLATASERMTNDEIGSEGKMSVLSPEHPYIKFLLENPGGFMDNRERSNFIASQTYAYDFLSSDEGVRRGNGRKPDGTFDSQAGWMLNPWPLTHGGIAPATLEDARANLYMIKLDAEVPNFHLYDDAAIRFKTFLRGQAFSAAAVLTNIHQFCDFSKETGATPKEIRTIGRLRIALAFDDRLRDEITTVTEAMKELAETNLKGLKQRSAPMSEWIEHYQTYEATGVFLESQPLKRNFELELLERMKTLSPDEKYQAAKTLLERRQFAPGDDVANTPSLEAYRERIPSREYAGASTYTPELRSNIIEYYTDGLARSSRMETPSNIDALKARVDEICEQTTSKMREDILWELAEKIQSQRDLTNYIGEKVHEGYSETTGNKKAELSVKGLESLHRHMTATPEKRAITIEFFAHSYDDNLARKALDVLDLQSMSTHDTSHLGSLASEENRLAVMRMMHSYYTASSDTTKIGVMASLLFPNGDKDFSQSKQYVYEKVLPVDETAPDKAGKQRGADNKFLRQALDKLMANSLPEGGPDESYNRLLLAAILAGSSGDAKGSNYTALCRAVQSSGALGKKFIQALNSYPGISDALRAASKDSKTNADPPNRGQLWAMFDEFGPTSPYYDAQGQLVGKRYEGHLGARLGAASTAVVADVTQPGSSYEEVIKIILPGLIEQAERQFKVYNSTLKGLAFWHPRIKPAIGINRQAMDSLRIEVNMDAAAQQKAIATEQSHGFEVVVEGRRVRFETVKRTRAGESYEGAIRARGEHFNDLPTDTPEAEQTRWIAATAMAAKETYLRMSGLSADKDRHGGQQHIRIEADAKTGEKVIVISEFDHGGQALVPPTDAEKKIVASAISRAMRRASKEGKEKFGGIIVEELSKIAKSRPSLENFISAEIRDMLAQQDYVRVAETRPGTMQAVVQTVINTGNVDPVIGATLRTPLYFMSQIPNPDAPAIEIRAPATIAVRNAGKQVDISSLHWTTYAGLKFLSMFKKIDGLPENFSAPAPGIRNNAQPANAVPDMSGPAQAPRSEAPASNPRPIMDESGALPARPPASSSRASQPSKAPFRPYEPPRGEPLRINATLDPETRALMRAMAAELLLKSFGIDEAHGGMEILTSGRLRISTDSSHPDYTSNMQRGAQLEAANRLLGNPLEISKVGDTVTFTLKPASNTPADIPGTSSRLLASDKPAAPHTATPEEAIAGRALRVQQLLAESSDISVSPRLAQALPQLLQIEGRYSAISNAFDFIDRHVGEMQELGPLQQQVVPEVHQYMELSRQYRAISDKTSEAAQVKYAEMTGLKIRFREQTDQHIGKVQSQFDTHVRLTRMTRSMNVLSTLQGIAAIQQIENNTGLTSFERNIGRAMAYSQLGTGVAGVAVDSRTMFNPSSLAGARFGMVSNTLGFGVGGYEMYEGYQHGDALGFTMGTAHMGISSAGGMASYLTYAGKAPALAGGLGLAAAGGFAVVSVAVVGLKLYANHVDSQGMAEEEKAFQALKQSQNLPGITAYFGDINVPLKPKMDEYTQLGTLSKLPAQHRWRYDTGSIFDLKPLKENPKALEGLLYDITVNNKEAGERYTRIGKNAVLMTSSDFMKFITFGADSATGIDGQKTFNSVLDKGESALTLARQSEGALAEVRGELSPPGSRHPIRGYNARMDEYEREFKPLEQQGFGPQIAELEKLRDIIIATRNHDIQFVIAERMGMTAYSEPWKEMAEEYQRGANSDAGKMAQVAGVAASGNIKLIQNFLGISDANWNHKEAEGKSARELFQTAISEDNALQLLQGYMYMTSEGRKATEHHIAKLIFADEMAKVEPMLARDAEKARENAPRLAVVMQALKQLPLAADPKKAQEQVLKAYDEMQAARGISGTDRASQKTALTRLLEEASATPADASKAYTVAAFIQGNTQGEAAEFFSRNREFLEKTKLTQRPDLNVGLVGLTGSMDEYMQKKYTFAPTTLSQEAQKAITEQEKTLEAVSKDNELRKARVTLLAQEVLTLGGGQLPEPPLYNRDGSPMLKDGKPVTAPEMIRSYEEAITAKKSELDQMSKKALQYPSKDLDAQIVIGQSVIAQWKLTVASIEEKAMKSKQETAGAILRDYRKDSMALFDDAIAAQPLITPDQMPRTMALEQEAANRMEEMQKRGKASPDYPNAEAAFLQANRRLSLEYATIAKLTSEPYLAALSEQYKRDESSLTGELMAQEKLAYVRALQTVATSGTGVAKDKAQSLLLEVESKSLQEFKKAQATLRDASMSLDQREKELAQEAAKPAPPAPAATTDARKDIARQLDSLRESNTSFASQTAMMEAQITAARDTDLRMGRITYTSPNTLAAQERLAAFRAEHPPQPEGEMPVAVALDIEKTRMQQLVLERKLTEQHASDVDESRSKLGSQPDGLPVPLPSVPLPMGGPSVPAIPVTSADSGRDALSLVALSANIGDIDGALMALLNDGSLEGMQIRGQLEMRRNEIALLNESALQHPSSGAAPGANPDKQATAQAAATAIPGLASVVQMLATETDEKPARSSTLAGVTSQEKNQPVADASMLVALAAFQAPAETTSPPSKATPPASLPKILGNGPVLS